MFKAGGFTLKENPIPAHSTLSVGGVFSQAGQRVNLENLLRAYGENPYVHAAVSRIAETIGETIWHLFTVKTDGEREEEKDLNHPLKLLLNNPNPDMTGQDLLELTEKFILLTGKAYWVRQLEGKLNELFLVPSPWLHPVYDRRTDASTGKQYNTMNIIGYMYDRDGIQRPFNKDLIIPFVMTDPYNLEEGIGPTHAISDDVDIFNFQRLVNKYFFYYGCDPGTIISFKDDLSQAEADRITSKYSSEHQAYGRQHKLLVIGGDATVTKEGVTQRDMEFIEGQKNERDITLGSYGMGYATIGGSEDIIRANAEAQDYVFQAHNIRPKLQFIRRKLNKYLVPLYGQNQELDFQDQTPENRESKINEAIQAWNAGLYTRNQALQILGQPVIEEPEGDEYKTPSSNPFEGWYGNKPEEKPEEPKKPEKPEKPEKEEGLKKNLDEGEEEWKEYIRRTEAYEKPFLKSLLDLFKEYEDKSVELVEQSTSRLDALIDVDQFAKDYEAKIFDPLSIALLDSFEKGRELIAPSTPHKDFPQLPNLWALEWLDTRIKWMASEIGKEAESILREILKIGYQNGDSLKDMAKKIRASFAFSPVRAMRITRTEIIAAANQGAIEGYLSTGIVHKVKFYTARDERTCDYCLNYHGEEFQIHDEMPIPLHPNCRCKYLAVLDEDI